MEILKKISDCFFKQLTVRKTIGMLLGNALIGIGASGLRLSLMGNDPYTAANLALSEGFHIGLGAYQLTVNILLLLIQLIWGRAYIGLGSVVNMCLLGYVIQYTSIFIGNTIGDGSAGGFLYQLVYMLISLMIISLGLSMYQVADLGVSPYDYLALGMTEHFKSPYFINRVLTDTVCVLLIVFSALTRFISWADSHLGLGTVLAAFCLGPFVNMFNKWNRKWILPSETISK